MLATDFTVCGGDKSNNNNKSMMANDSLCEFLQIVVIDEEEW